MSGFRRAASNWATINCYPRLGLRCISRRRIPTAARCCYMFDLRGRLVKPAFARAGEEIADVFQLTHSRDRIAGAPRLEIGDGQCDEVAEQARAKLDIDTTRRVREHVGAQSTQRALENRDCNEPDDQDIERGEPAMDKHLVDHDLEEDRRDKGKELQEERSDQDFGQNPAVFVYRLNEPGDVEFPGKVPK